MAEGMIEFLTEPNDPCAKYLRESCVFRIIPMVNPDGVIHGNYRSNLEGSDLNRKWNGPRKDY
jgi:cytosolic carboxypeptidase protein 2/3